MNTEKGTRKMNAGKKIGSGRALAVGRLLRRGYLTSLAVGLLALCAAAPASAAFELDTMASSFGSSQAGAHTDYRLSFEYKKGSDGSAGADTRSLDVTLPPGLVGNQQATPTCSMAQIIETITASTCPTSTIVGFIKVRLALNPGEPAFDVPAFIYNIEPYKDEPAAFGSFPFFPVRIDTSVGPESGYRVKVEVRNIVEAAVLESSEVVMFGVPADINGVAPPGAGLYTSGYPPIEIGVPGSGQRTALMTNPTQCAGGLLRTDLTTTPWGAPTTTSTFAEMGSVGGCEKLTFRPTLSLRPTQLGAGSPTGYGIDITVPQNEDAGGLATPAVKDVKLNLPEGVVLSPSIAHGLNACTTAQLDPSSNDEASCPESAKIATIDISTPLIDGSLEGSLYVGEPLPGNRYRLFVYIHDRGVTLKIEGKVTLDPETGQITTTFPNTPQLPYSNLHIQLKDGADAALANPRECGMKTVTAELTSYAGSVARPTDSFMIENCGDAGKFTPSMDAGSANPIAGVSSPFIAQFVRRDGEQNVSQVDVTLPKGVAAKLAGVALCPEAGAATGACPATSQIGTMLVGAGSGPDPLYIPQPGKAPTAIYLAGPYKGAPYSMIVKAPVEAGPFDLGTVTVRSPISVNPDTVQVTVKSDPLPQILEGIPILYRDIRIDVDRPGFASTPTNCDPLQVNGRMVSRQGKVANVAAAYQVGSCGRLGFKPKLALSLSGGPSRRGGHPALKAVLTANRGDANIDRVAVTLPKTEFLENSHIQTVCTRVQYAAHACPAKSIYGYAKAWSPLLDEPLAGPVYLRSSSHELPDLVASLGGQIQVDLDGRIDSVNARIRSTFEGVPDAPVSKFVLIMKGGKKGLLVNNTDICRATPRAEVKIQGQNGKTANSAPIVKTDCAKGRKKK
jgi:hypothetical protein